MTNNKSWLKHKEGKQTLIAGETILAEILPLKTKKDFNVVVGDKKFRIISSGALGQKLEIRSLDEEIVLKLKPEKWYSNTFLIQFYDKDYKLVVRNNPLCEFVILTQKEELIAYGLDALKGNNHPALRTTEKNNDQPILFHVLLWYFFEPVARENSGDSFWWIYGI